MQPLGLPGMAPGTARPPLALWHSLSLGFLKFKLSELQLLRSCHSGLIFQVAVGILQKFA